MPRDVIIASVQLAEAPATTATAARTRPRLDALTSVRFFAAILVVIYHFAGPLKAHLPVVAQWFIAAGYRSVGLFFVLSGFILIYNYATSAGTLRGSRRSFWVARLARIYPVYFLAFLLAIPSALSYAAEHYALKEGIIKLTVGGSAYLSLFHAWIPRARAFWNFPSWSVSVEVFFYLCFPFLLPLIARLRLPATFAVMALCSLASLLPPFVVLNGVDLAKDHGHIEFSPIGRLPEFILGMCVGRAFALTMHRNRWPSALTWLASALCVAVLTANHLWPAVLHEGGAPSLVFAFLVYALARDEGFLSRLLAHPKLILLGEASYGIYILQAPVLFLITWRSPDLAVPVMTLGQFTLYLAALLAISVASFLWLETPARRWIRSHLDPRPA